MDEKIIFDIISNLEELNDEIEEEHGKDYYVYGAIANCIEVLEDWLKETGVISDDRD